MPAVRSQDSLTLLYPLELPQRWCKILKNVKACYRQLLQKRPENLHRHRIVPMEPRMIRIAQILLIAAVALHPSGLYAQEQWGEPSNSLRLSLAIDSSKRDPVFSIRNDGNDQMVPLGISPVVAPEAFTLTLTTRDGRFRNQELRMKSSYWALGTGVYSIVILLLKDSTYSIRHPIDDFGPPPLSNPGAKSAPLSAVLKPGDLLTGHLRT
jgi:hypothetical protein